MTALDPDVWGPHFWFFLHTIAISYPNRPNDVTKKKYYEFIMNLPLFLPVEKIGNDFGKLIDEYPVSSYLDSKDSLVRWMHFIHNKINEKLERPTISLNDFYTKYYDEYKPKNIKMQEHYKWKEKIIYMMIVLGATGVILYFYNK